MARYEDLPEEIKEMLSAETRASIHAIREELGLIRAHQDLTKLRVDKIEETFKQQQEDTKEVLDAVRTIKSGMKVTNFLRDAFVWTSGIITSGYALWQIFKDYLK